jgi:hypothetical protein
MAIHQEEIDRFNEIIMEMRTLLDEADFIIRSSGERFIHERAKAYPLGHIDAALDHENSFTCNKYDITLSDILSELEAKMEPEEDDEESDEDCDEEIPCAIHGQKDCPRC